MTAEIEEPARPIAFRPLPVEMLDRTGQPFDPPEALARLHETGPVSRMRLPNGAYAWLVTGYEQARTVFADPRFSADSFRRPHVTSLRPEEIGEDGTAITAPGMTERRDGFFLFMDPPEHTRLRRLLVSQFTVRRMRALEARIREIAIEHIGAMRAAGTEADLVPAFALPLPSLVICELLGVPYADRARFQESSAISMNFYLSDEQRAQAQAAIYAFITELVAAKRANPGDDLLSGLMHGDADPPLTGAELVDIGTLLLGAGHETTANMLALSTFALLEHPGQLAALRADPNLIGTAVEELLRYLSIIHSGPTRLATEDVTLGGTTIAAGDTVVVSVPQANRAPGHWPDPDRLDLSRPRSAHLAFGHGVHQCLGQQLARAELRVGLTELFARLPGLRLAVPASGIPLRTDMIVFGVHSLPVAWDEDEKGSGAD